MANAQAAMEQAQNNVEAATLTAPSDGTIAAINGAVGQWVSGGASGTSSSSSTTTGTSTGAASTLFTLVDLNNLEVTAQVNEADIGKVKVGDPVTFNVSAYPDVNFDGKVLSIQPVGTTVQNVVNYNVTSSIQTTKDAALYPGMTATVTIVSAEHDDVVRVPNTALSFAQTAFRQGLVQFNREGAPSGTPRPAGSFGQGGANSGGRAAGTGGAPGQAGQGATGGPQFGQGGQGGANGQGGAASGGFQRAGGNGGGNPNQGVVLTLKNNELTPVRVTLGLTDGSFTEITSGLNSGDQIVVGMTGGTTSTGSNTQRTGNGGPGGGGPGGPPGGAVFFRG